jgi:hypothetical protein
MATARLAADATAKVVIRDGGGEARAILLCSSPLEPDQVAVAVAAAARARQLLSGAAGDAILDPLASGRAGGLSYAVFPWCVPLSGGRLGSLLQRLRLRPRLLAWLREKVRLTQREVTPAAMEESFLGPLADLVACGELSQEVRASAGLAARRLREGGWRPRFVLAHNDLWAGNVLFRRRAPLLWGRQAPFVVIDWAGARENGDPFYDLVRLAESLGLKAGALVREVHWTCAALGCEPADAMGYLLAGLGRLGRSLGHFPRDRYLQLIDRCRARLFTALR